MNPTTSLISQRPHVGQRTRECWGQTLDKEMCEVACLNRVFRWCLPAGGRAEAIEIEADARHVEILILQLNLQNAKWLATPGVKSRSSDVGPTLPLETHTPFRFMCVRANFLAEDRPDVRFACKEIARLMSEPCDAGYEQLKRLGRFLDPRKRVVCADLGTWDEISWQVTLPQRAELE